jgi:hypothetical protein
MWGLAAIVIAVASWLFYGAAETITGSRYLDWLAASRLSPRGAFVTHGEPAAADAFRRRLVDAFGWKAVMPEMEARHVLD